MFNKKKKKFVCYYSIYNDALRNGNFGECFNVCSFPRTLYE